MYDSCCQHYVVLDVIVVMVVEQLAPPLYVSDSHHHIVAVVDQVAACAPIVCKWVRAGHATCDTRGSVYRDWLDRPPRPNIVHALHLSLSLLTNIVTC